MGGRGALAVAVVALALAGCGSNGSSSNRAGAAKGSTATQSSSSGNGSRSAKASTSASGAAPATGNGVASKSPAQIVAAAQAAVRSARGFVLAGTLRQSGQTARIQIIEEGTAKSQLKMSQGGRSAAIIVLPTAAYVRANRGFWSAQGTPRAATLANHWIQLPASASQQLTANLGAFAPGTFARCLGENLGTLSRAGTTTVRGKPAVVVRQAGNAPGSSPGTLAVATTGPAYPLRLTSTGPTKRGGKVDACNDGKGGDIEGTMTVSDFGHAPPIVPPKHAMIAGPSANSSA